MGVYSVTTVYLSNAAIRVVRTQLVVKAEQLDHGLYHKAPLVCTCHNALCSSIIICDSACINHHYAIKGESQYELK